MEGQQCQVAVELRVVNLDENHPFRSILLKAPAYSIRIGRGSKSSIADLFPSFRNAWFDSRVMSRDHAVLRADPISGVVHIEDVGSMHGTFVRGQRLRPFEPKLLLSGDLIKFGNEVTRGPESFPPLEVTMKYTVHPFYPPTLSCIKREEKSIVTTNSFKVPEELSDDDDDVAFIQETILRPKPLSQHTKQEDWNRVEDKFVGQSNNENISAAGNHVITGHMDEGEVNSSRENYSSRSDRDLPPLLNAASIGCIQTLPSVAFLTAKTIPGRSRFDDAADEDSLLPARAPSNRSESNNKVESAGTLDLMVDDSEDDDFVVGSSPVSVEDDASSSSDGANSDREGSQLLDMPVFALAGWKKAPYDDLSDFEEPEASEASAVSAVSETDSEYDGGEYVGFTFDLAKAKESVGSPKKLHQSFNSETSNPVKPPLLMRFPAPFVSHDELLEAPTSSGRAPSPSDAAMAKSGNLSHGLDTSYCADPNPFRVFPPFPQDVAPQEFNWSIPGQYESAGKPQLGDVPMQCEDPPGSGIAPLSLGYPRISIQSIIRDQPEPSSPLSPQKRKLDQISADDENNADENTAGGKKGLEVPSTANPVSDEANTSENITATPVTKLAETVPSTFPQVDEPPVKRAKTTTQASKATQPRTERHTSLGALAATALAGALVGGVGVVAALVSLPSDFFV